MYGFQGTTSAISFLGRLFQEKGKKRQYLTTKLSVLLSFKLRKSLRLEGKRNHFTKGWFVRDTFLGP